MTIRDVLRYVPLLLAGWLALLAGVMLTSDAAPAALVFGPPGVVVAHLDEDVAILAMGHATLTVQSDAPGLARNLYRAGAWLVLPAGLTGWLPLPRALALKASPV